MIKTVVEILKRTDNIDISKYDRSFLERSLEKRMARMCFDTFEGYLGFFEQTGRERAAFIGSLRVSYSQFFRNPITCAVLERIVLPALVLKKSERRNEIRIWSAACAKGEEAYSLAIMLEELRNGSDRFRYRIIATDQSAEMISMAMKGEYAAAELDNLSLKRAAEWFDRQGDIYAVKPALKENIDFSGFDLLGSDLSCPPASIFGDFDLVFCANLLFYYSTGEQKKILDKAGGCLARDGLLLTGEAEREIVMDYNYREIFPQSAIFKRILP